MATRHTTFVMIQERTSRIRHLKFSRTHLFCAALTLVLGLGVVSCVFYDYFRLKSRLPSTVDLERQVKQQRAQIQVFARRINGLKSEIEGLRDFEKKIRVLADVESAGGEDSVFGVGGPLPTDLASELPLADRHDGLLRQMHDQVDVLCDVSALQKDIFGDLEKYLEGRKSLLACTPTIWPTKGWISSGFGYRTSPFTGLREFHRGLDIAARKGTPVKAPADGRVTFAGRKGGFGRMLVINHGHGVVTRYGHLEKCLVKRGVRVKRGDEIALVGNTGRTTAPHLHYEVHVDGMAVNPRKYIIN